jgi:hypothetical protein
MALVSEYGLQIRESLQLSKVDGQVIVISCDVSLLFVTCVDLLSQTIKHDRPLPKSSTEHVFGERVLRLDSARTWTMYPINRRNGFFLFDCSSGQSASQDVGAVIKDLALFDRGRHLLACCVTETGYLQAFAFHLLEVEQTGDYSARQSGKDVSHCLPLSGDLGLDNKLSEEDLELRKNRLKLLGLDED